MTSSAALQGSYRVRFDESGPDGRLPASGFLRYAQDLAWLHSNSAGFDRGWYEARGTNWLIRAVELNLVGSVRYGEEVTVTTEVVGFRRVWARRRSEFSRADDGRSVGVATIDWVLLSASGQPVRVPAELVERFGRAASGEFTPLRVQLAEASDAATTAHFGVRRSELDPLDHVNNAAYLDYFDEQLVGAGRPDLIDRLPRRYRIEYARPAPARARVAARLWGSGDGDWQLLLTDADGRQLTRAVLEADPADWVGG